MQINNYQNQSTNFRAVFPVQHWIAESARGSYALADMKTSKKLQGKIIRALNKSLEESSKEMILAEQNLRTYLETCDTDYKNICEFERKKMRESRFNKSDKQNKKLTKIRSFYNRENSNVENFEPFVYAISGVKIKEFEDELAKRIGIEKSKAKGILSHCYSPEALAAIDAYNKSGLDFVNNAENRIKSKSTGMTYVLHTKFEIIRNKLGKVKDYRLVDARFLPEYGPESPLVKLGWIK